MQRSLALALLGLFFLAGPAAARGDGPAAGDRRAEPAGSARAERALLLRRVVAVRPAAPVPAAVSSAAGARDRGGVPGHRGGAAARAASARWAQGLPPALHVQAQECPAGTMATLAEGHDDVVRCIPF